MNVRTIVLILAIFALLSTATGGYLQYHSARESAAREIKRELTNTSEALKDNVLDLILLNQSQARILAGFEQIRDVLLNQNPEALLQANLILDHFAENLAYDIGYLMDSSGKTIASSNRNQTDSFVGHNYSFRPYFIEAIQGRPSTYLAVGVTSGIRGIYFSQPVYGADGSRPIGVAVIKVSTQGLDSEFSRVRTGTELLVDKSGMIFVSNREDWTLRLLWRVSPEELSQILQTQQFGEGPWDWTGLETRGDNHAVDNSGEGYLIHEMSLENCPGWRLVSLYSVKEISGKFVNPLVGQTGYLALILCFLVGGAVIVLYVVAQRDIRSRKRGEEELKKSLSLLHSTIESTADGLLVVDGEGKIVVFNERFVEMWQIPQNVLESRDDDKALAFVLSQLTNPEAFLEKVKELYNRPELDSSDVLQFKDGRVFERHSQPQRIGDKVVGRVWSFRDVTEQNRADETLTLEKQRFQRLAENSPFGMVMIQPDGSFSYANPKFRELFGYDLGDVRNGREWFRKAYPDAGYRHTVISGWMEDVNNLARGETRPRVFTVTCKDGTEKTIHFRPVKLDSGEDLMTCEDITTRTRAEQAVRESEEKYRSLFDDSMDGIFINEADGMLIDANQSFLDLFGYAKEEMFGTNVIKLYATPEDRNRFRREIENRGSVKDYPLRFVKKDGTKIDCQLTGTVRKAIDGRILGYRGIIKDITERKRMEEELRQSEEWYRSLVEDSFDGIFVQKGQKIIFANSRLYEMLGYSEGELEGMDHWQVYHPDYHGITRYRALARMRGEQVTSHYEVMLQKKDGSSFFGEISARLVKMGGEDGIQVWVRDISGRRRSEEAQRRLAIAVEQAAEAIVITDTRGTIQYVNPAFEEIAGYSPDEVIGENPRILQSGEHDQAFYGKLWQTITNGKAWTGQFVNKKKDGTLYREDATISPVRDSSGKIVNYVAVKRDITHETQLQQQLLQAQKMEAIGTLAGGVAHDFNNLLQIVLGYSEILLKGKQEGDRDYAGIKKISQAGKRGADLVQSLLTLSRKVEPQLRPSNLNHEILQVQKLLSRTIPKTIKIDLHLSGDLELIQADPSQVGQILMNLGVNARDAMPDGGTLTVETANVELDEDYCATHLEVKPGRYVALSVSDSGHGMDKETLSHIFEPFFTTKEAGKGTGLGLATVYGIVKQHDGHILCYSEPGHGTTFKIYLPSIQTEEESETQTEEMPIPGGTETILLVEDEEVLRELGTELLNDFGYEVITAGNGREALEIYQRERERIALVILDLIMPEMDGKQCLVEILGVDPKARILIASGYSQNGPIKRTSLTGARGFVEKPYNMRELLETIREVLDAD
ncbi:MAG: PAS domain S-box protein [Deltaproteobacteria bacterium]|nr:PAS domain S-box protein [Deltaproteobacteria bacterium]